MSHLQGTPLLRAYMHGFFLDNRLYHKAKDLADPFAYETYRQQRIEAKLEAERKSRIGLVQKLPKVDSGLLPGFCRACSSSLALALRRSCVRHAWACFHDMLLVGRPQPQPGAA